MANTVLPADRLKTACEKAAVKRRSERHPGFDRVIAMLHLSSAALSFNSGATVTVSSEEFALLADNW